MNVQLPKGPYTLAGHDPEVIAGVPVAGLVFRDNDGSLAIMAPDPEGGRMRLAGVNPISFDPKRGQGHKMTFEDDPVQTAVARLFMASPVLWGHRAEIITGLNMMVNGAQGHSLAEWIKVRDEVYAAFTSVTGDKPADSVSHHKMSLDEALGTPAPKPKNLSAEAALAMAVEFGFKQHEKGNNLQAALANFNGLIAVEANEA